MDELSCKENRTKSYGFAGIHNHRKEVVRTNQATKELVCSSNLQSTECLVGNI